MFPLAKMRKIQTGFTNCYAANITVYTDWTIFIQTVLIIKKPYISMGAFKNWRTESQFSSVQ